MALARRSGNTWYIAAINATEQTKEYKVAEMMEEINGRNVRIYEGGNSPAVREVEAKKLSKAKISVPKNDGVVIVFTAE